MSTQQDATVNIHVNNQEAEQKVKEDLLISIQTAGVYNGGKDKRGEKLAESDEDRLESRTDGSDAFDTVVIGCERFPQQTISLAVTSSFC